MALWLLVPARPAFADERQLIPSIGVKEAYNDNIFFDVSDHQTDYVTTLLPALEFTDRTERLDARLRAEAPIFRYVHNDALDDVDQHYTGGLRYLLTERIGTSFRGGYSRTSQPDRDILETGLVIGNVIRHRYFGGFSSDYALSEISTVGISYDYLDDDYQNPGYTDMQSHNAALTFARDLSQALANTRIRAILGYTRYDFSDSSVDNYSGMVGFVKRLTEIYSLSADVGVRYTRSEFEVSQLEPVSPGLFRIVTQTETSGKWGPAARAALSYNGEYTSASFSFFEDISTSGGNAGTVQRTSFVFDVGRRFTYDLWAHLSAGYYLNTSDGTQYALQDIDEETWRVNPWVRYNLSRDLSLDASYSYTRVNYKTNDTDADRNLVFLRLVYRYPLFQ
jgi:hypothetical protein